MKMTRFLDLPCLELTHGDLSLYLTTSVGPRVLAFTVDGENLFAELPETTLDHPSGRKFHLYGGHRLWAAPEEPAVTYLPDDGPVEIEEIGEGVRVVQADAGTGIMKTLAVGFTPEGTVRVEHVLKNLGDTPVDCAPWAITQLRTGGTAILPQPGRIPGYSNYQPNRALVLWPYTDIADPGIYPGNRFVFVSADRQAGALKVGCPNPDGWLAYHRDGLLFVKQAEFDPDAVYFDLGASSQVYCNAGFLELETLGPKVTLSPGQAAVHVDTWQVFRDVDFDGTETGAAGLAALFT
jgi:hypothetical protein